MKIADWRGKVEASDRVDRWAHERLAGYSLAAVRALIWDGRLLVNGRRIMKGAQVRPGDVVTVAGVAPGAGPMAEGGALTVVWEDEAVAVVDKPAGMPTQPLAPDERGTLINLTVARFPQTRGVGGKPLEPGLLHRLDTGTRGLVMIALTAEAFAALAHDLKMGRVHKTYRALVAGEVDKDEGEIKVPLGRSFLKAGLMVPAVEGVRFRGKPMDAVTRYRVLERGSDVSLLELDLLTGVMHQLRVHLAFIGHPVLGDDRYGPDADPDSREYGLQAARLEFRHPAAGRNVRAEAGKLLGLIDAEEFKGRSGRSG
jgi:23S rRNA pseudouridine1911/1915/1917 synthase